MRLDGVVRVESRDRRMFPSVLMNFNKICAVSWGPRPLDFGGRRRRWS